MRLGDEDVRLLRAAGFFENAGQINIGPANLVAGAGLILAGELNRLPECLFGALHVALSEGVQAQIQERLGPGGIYARGYLEIFIRFVVFALDGIREAQHVIGQEIARIIFELLSEFRGGFGHRLPFVDRQNRQAEEVVSVRSAGIELDGALQLANRVGHVFGVAIGPAEEHVQRTAIAGKLDHLLEDCRSTLLCSSILRVQQTDPQRVQSLDIGLNLDGMRERVGRFSVFGFARPGPAIDDVRSHIVRSGESLLRIRNRIVQTVRLQFRDREIDPRVWELLKIERAAV